MKIEIELPEIEGYEYTGEYRKPKEMEHYVDLDGRPFQRGSFIPEEDEEDKHLILRKLKPKREFTDGAFYPVVYKGREGIWEYQESSNSLDGVHIDYPSITWIGPELKIEWGEG